MLLRCSVVGESDEDEITLSGTNGMKSSTYDYDDDREPSAYQSGSESKQTDRDEEARDARKSRQNAMLMPGSANLSFGVKGWLASGLKVDSLTIDTKKSKGLGEGVRPYKGVKYLTVSRKGIEVRC